MSRVFRTALLASWLAVLTLLCPGVAGASCPDPTGTLISTEGSVAIRGSASDAWADAHPEDGVCEGDTLHTARNSRAAVSFNGAETLVRLDQGTTLRIGSSRQEAGEWRLTLLEGAARFSIRVSRRLRIDTPNLTASVEGTELVVQADADRSAVDLFKGQVLLANDRGKLRLRGTQSARAARGEAPRLVTVLHPEDAVQWTLSYEPMLSALLWTGRDDRDPALHEALHDAYRQLVGGDAEAAFARLDAVPAAQQGAAFHNLRAAMFLSVGRADSARLDLAAARTEAPGNGDSDAIESSIALALNDKARALALAQSATASAPDRPLPWFALSYAKQAAFDLPAALAAMDKSLAADPQNGLLSARLAELLLASGELDAAQQAADRAVAAAPQAALAHRAQGFAALLRIHLTAAEAAFRQALALDSADPVAHLGLGLTLVRSGRLAAGREQIEIAVMLDPLASLLRTYLGKAYYDEHRDALAATAYKIAQQLDPKDPTPWLFRAIQLRAENRPVEALESLDTSLALNDYRAQFRSVATLQADAASRTAAVGQIYRDLNFDQVALVRGWQAVEQAPDDQSGHRLLSEVYSVLPRHEEARVSELLQAQLLQPLTRTPIQPLMGEARLMVPEGMGPSNLGLNEYGPLFERNGASGWVTLVGGGRNTFGEEVLASALIDRVAFSVGQYHLETDGSGGIRPQKQDIQVGFVQGQLSPETGVQAEFRDTDTREWPSASTSGHDRVESQSDRLGLTHRWSPGSTFIASLIHRRINTLERKPDPSDPESFSNVSYLHWTSEWAMDGWATELRQDWRLERLHLSLGATRFDYISERDYADFFPLFGESSRTDSRWDQHLDKAWLYATIRPTSQIDVTLGLSWGSWDQRKYAVTAKRKSASSSLDTAITQFNGHDERLDPKVGLSWHPLPGTTLRAAAFRTLRGPDPINQTIEPTEVSGFNQLFDGFIGESAWRYGVGFDQRVSSRLLFGAEASRRERSVPIEFIARGYSTDEYRERFARAYIACTPTLRLALSAEYFYEERILRLQGPYVRTHRTPLTASYFLPNGLFGSVSATSVQQFVQEHPEDRTDFWNLDLLVGFRLPNRLGVVLLSASNLLDEDIRFLETDPNRPFFVGGRVLALRATLQF